MCHTLISFVPFGCIHAVVVAELLQAQDIVLILTLFRDLILFVPLVLWRLLRNLIWAVPFMLLRPQDTLISFVPFVTMGHRHVGALPYF